MAVKLASGRVDEKKSLYDEKLCRLMGEFSKILVVAADHVGSKQLHDIRKDLRGDSVLLMGKNTMMKRSIKNYAQNTGNKFPLNLLPFLVGNVGLLFTKGDFKEVREAVAKYKVRRPARVGLIAPHDVVLPPGKTILDPSQNPFFQALEIPTKITRGKLEILTRVKLIKKGDKVSYFAVRLLSRLKINPFIYRLNVVSVYENGSVFSPKVLDLTEDDLVERFRVGVSILTSVSLATSYPILAAASHMFINAYNNALAVAISTEYSFPAAEKVKEYLKDPSKFVILVAGSTVAQQEKEADLCDHDECVQHWDYWTDSDTDSEGPEGYGCRLCQLWWE
ncbi:hypothetical protein UlMin_001041 [Ulmus minor]